MLTRDGNLHLEIQTSRKSPVGILRTTFRDREGRIRHSQHGRITGCSLQQLRLLQLAFREKVLPTDHPDAFQVISSKEYGACASVFQLAKLLQLDKAIYSRHEPWVDCLLAMIVGRVVYAGSKLSLCNHWEDSALWDLAGVVARPDVERHCYLPMDRLLERQKSIQKTLAAKHLQNGHLVLYDITSSYLEGAYENSELVDFGYNRDGKKGHEQIVIGLLCSAEGCPVGVEVYPGNTQDVTTVMDRVQELKQDYAMQEVIFVGDRGMITQTQIERMASVDGLRVIGALRHSEMVQLLARKVVQMEFFDENNICEVLDPDQPGWRYCLCKNPQSAARESQTRQRLLELTQQSLASIASYKQACTVEKLAARVGRVLEKYKMGKFVIWNIEADGKSACSKQHRLQYKFDQEKIEAEKRFDGCYIVRSDVPGDRLNKDQLVRSYKDLALVETAFRNLKTVQLEMRPVYHKRDDRIRAHVFLCVLAYYLQWHMNKALAPLFAEDGVGAERRWTFRSVVERLMTIRQNRTRCAQTEFTQITLPDKQAQQILDLLGVKLT